MGAEMEIHSFHSLDGFTFSDTEFSGPVLPGGLTYNDITGQTMRHKRADNDTLDLADTIPIPTTGEVYGWRKHTKLFCRNKGGVTVIGNVRWFIGPEPLEWEGQVGIYAKIGTYTSASSTDNTTRISAAIDGNSITNSTPLRPLAGFPTGFDGFLNGNYGDNQKFVVQQLSLKPGCVSEIKPGRIFSYRYDEM